ncbi:MAG: hypothetical protein PHD79_09435 [Aliarcobacter sp.]|nr:hypothetical protein [Aliarcobacter sp.]
MAKVKEDIEYSNHLIKVHNVMNVLDLPNNQEETFRKILTKQDNKTLEEMAKKSKNEILTLIVKEQNKVTENTKEQNIKIEKEEIKKQNQENNLKNETKNLKDKQTLNNENIFNQLKVFFTPQILDQNIALVNEFNSFDNKSIDKKYESIQKIISILKANPSIIKSITEQL